MKLIINQSYCALPYIFDNAKVLRQRSTKAEQHLWKMIRNSQLMGFKFRRQHPLKYFIADFYCHEALLVIELDGSIHELENIKQNAFLNGSSTETMLAVEYSYIACPFCFKQFQDTKLDPILKAQYGDKIAFGFKQNRGVNHKGTEAKAIASLCAQKIGGDAAYIKFYKSVMDKSTNEGGVMDVTKLPEVAKAAGLDVAKWQQCVDKKDTAALFAAQTSEAQKYNLAGTPGTLLINLTTGKYETVEGAYPFSTFSTKIDALMK